MSTHDEKDLLARTLRQRSDTMAGHGLGLDDVRDRARGIRRRRRAVTGVVAAAVLAVAVPVGLSATDLLGTTSPSPLPPASSGEGDPAPRPGPEPTPGPDGSYLLKLDGLPDGDPAGEEYVLFEERTLVTPDGLRDLPEAYSMITPYAGGWLAVGSERSPEDVVRLDDQLEVTRTTAGGAGLAVSADGSQVAYAEQEDADSTRLVSAPTDGGDVTTWTFPFAGPDDLVTPVGFLGRDTVAYTDELGDTMGIAGPGDERTPLEGFLRLDDASEANGLVSGLVSYRTGGGCSGVMDPADGRLLWKSCDHSTLRFSPDGRYVTAFASYFDGPGSPTLSVLDARTGELVVDFAPERGGRTLVGVSQAAWEDDGSVLAILSEDGEVGMVRAGLDGSLELVAGPIPAPDLSMPLWFAEVPR